MAAAPRLDGAILASVKEALETDAVAALRRFQTARPPDFHLHPNAPPAEAYSAVAALLVQPLCAPPQHSIAEALLVLRRDNAPPLRCGHVFADSEPNYTCLDCASDRTCVLCHDCFHASEHQQHRHALHFSGGGGCCDCGDEEAWRSSPCCANHLRQPNELTTPGEVVRRLPSAVAKHLHAVIVAVIQEAMDVLLQERPEWNIGESGASLNTATVYNDESHTFDEVISELMAATGCTAQMAQQWAFRVDSDGRAVVKVGMEPQCVRVAEALGEKALDCQVELLGQIFLQEQSSAALTWLAAEAKRTDCIRALVCGALCNMSLEDIMADRVDAFGSQQRRLGAFLVDYVKLWKGPRQAFRELIFNSLLIEPLYKPILAIDFMSRYKDIQAKHAEDEHNEEDSISQLSIQLFTVNSIARELVQAHHALETLIDQLESYCADFYDARAMTIKIDAVPEKHPLVDVDFRNVVNDLGYLLQGDVGDLSSSFIRCDTESEERSCQWDRELKTLFEFLRQFQGMDMQTRLTQSHVVFESRSWIAAFTVSMTLNKRLIPAIVSRLGGDCGQLHTALEALSAFVVGKPNQVVPEAITRTAEGISVVSKGTFDSQCSFHWPLQRLFVQLVQKLIIADPTVDIRQLFHGNMLHTCLCVLDPCLRTVMHAAEIEANRWVRNGMVMMQRLLNYKGAIGREHMFNADVAALQVCGAALGCTHFVAILDAYVNSRSTMADAPTRLEVLFELVLHVYSARHFPGVSVASSLDAVRYHLVQMLCGGPSQFSKLAKTLTSDDKQRHEGELTAIVREIAEYDEAQSTYALRPELLGQYDPFYLNRPLMTSSQSLEYVRQKLSGQSLPSPAPLPPWSEPLRALDEFPRCGRVLDLIFHALLSAVGGAAEGTFLDSRDVAAAAVTDRCVAICIQFVTTALAQEEASDMRPLASALLAYTREGVTLCQVLARLREGEILPLDTFVQAQVRWIQGALLDACGSEDETARLLSLGFSHGHEAKRAKTMQAKDKDKKAKQRQARLMARFAKKQAKFQLAAGEQAAASGAAASGGGGEGGTREEAVSGVSGVTSGVTGTAAAAAAAAGEAETKAAAQVRCLQCQDEGDPATSDKTFIVLGSVHRGGVLVPPADAVDESAEAFALFSCSATPLGETYFTTCNHTLHLACWEETMGVDLSRAILRGEGLFQCPLCRMHANIVVPVLKLTTARHVVSSDVRSAVGAAGEHTEAFVGDDWLAPVTAATCAFARLHGESASPVSVDGGLLPGLRGVSDGEVKTARDLHWNLVLRTLQKQIPGGPAVPGSQHLLWRALGQTVASLELAARPAASCPANYRALPPATLGALRRLCDVARAAPALDSEHQMGMVCNEDLAPRTLVIRLFGGQHVDSSRANEGKELLDTAAGDAYSVLVWACMHLSMLTADASAGKRAFALARGDVAVESRGAAAAEGDGAGEGEGDLRLPLTPLIRACLELALLTEMAQLLQTGAAGQADALEAPDVHMASAEDCEAVGALGRALQQRFGLPPSAADALRDPAMVNLAVARVFGFLHRALVLQLVLTDYGIPSEGMTRFPTTYSVIAEQLALPTFGSLALDACSRLDDPHSFIALAATALAGRMGRGLSLTPPPVRLSFAPLPDEYSELIFKAQSATCVVQGMPIKNPALCMLCGTIVCTQSYCCASRDEAASRGGCTKHADKCCTGMGMFLLIKSGYTMTLSDLGGMFTSMPYVDEHGEPDYGLKRGCRTTLSRSLLNKQWRAWVEHRVDADIFKYRETHMPVQWNDM